jgi:hypothetical protein
MKREISVHVRLSEDELNSLRAFAWEHRVLGDSHALRLILHMIIVRNLAPDPEEIEATQRTFKGGRKRKDLTGDIAKALDELEGEDEQ